MARAIGIAGVAALIAACSAPRVDRQDAGPDGEGIASANPAATPTSTPGLVVPVRPASVKSRELDYPALRDCGVVSAGRWEASIEGEPEAPRKAVRITGVAATNPNVDFAIVLDPDIMESDPVQRRARMIATHPEGDTIDRLDRYEQDVRFTYEGELGILNLVCGDVVMATVRDPAEAR